MRICTSASCFKKGHHQGACWLQVILGSFLVTLCSQMRKYFCIYFCLRKMRKTIGCFIPPLFNGGSGILSSHIFLSYILAQYFLCLPPYRWPPRRAGITGVFFSPKNNFGFFSAHFCPVREVSLCSGPGRGSFFFLKTLWIHPPVIVVIQPNFL